MARADLGRINELKPDIYSDFLNGFNKVPFTGELAKVTGEDAIGQSLKNLFLTDPGERFYNTDLGGGIKNLLFELETHVDYDYDATKFKLQELANAYEPRAENLDINIQVKDNGVQFKITYRARNIPDQYFSIEFFVSRVR